MEREKRKKEGGKRGEKDEEEEEEEEEWEMSRCDLIFTYRLGDILRKKKKKRRKSKQLAKKRISVFSFSASSYKSSLLFPLK